MGGWRFYLWDTIQTPMCGSSAAAVEELVQSAEPLAELVLAHLIKLHGQTLDGKAKIVEELRPLIQEAQDPTATRVNGRPLQ